MDDCLFCKIIKKEIPAEVVYEDEIVLAFLDINPVNPGHTLVIPKEHSQDFISTNGETLRSVVSIIPKIAKAIMRGLNYDAFNLCTNNGKASGQEIMHLHFHIVPRREDDGQKLFEHRTYLDGEILEVTKKIRDAMK